MAEPQLKPARKGSVAYRKLLKQLSDGYYKSVSEPVLGETIAEGKFTPFDDPRATYQVVNDVIQPESREELIEGFLPSIGWNSPNLARRARIRELYNRLFGLFTDLPVTETSPIKMKFTRSQWEPPEAGYATLPSRAGIFGKLGSTSNYKVSGSSSPNWGGPNEITSILELKNPLLTSLEIEPVQVLKKLIKFPKGRLERVLANYPKTISNLEEVVLDRASHARWYSPEEYYKEVMRSSIPNIKLDKNLRDALVDAFASHGIAKNNPGNITHYFPSEHLLKNMANLYNIDAILAGKGLHAAPPEVMLIAKKILDIPGYGKRRIWDIPKKSPPRVEERVELP